MRWSEWILPALLVLAWMVTWATQRRVPFWFAGAALGVTLLTFPIGAVVLDTADQPEGCTGNPGCVPEAGLTWWLNGIHGLPTLGALAMLTLAVLAVRDGRERQRTGA